jgi:hypothetical protein
LKGNPKLLQKWQAYHRYRQTYDASWKTTVEKTWTDYKNQWEAENPGDAVPNKRFEVMNEFIRKTFSEETPKIMQEVEDYRRKLKEETDEVLDEDQNASYQTYVTIPTQLEVASGISSPMQRNRQTL